MPNSSDVVFLSSFVLSIVVCGFVEIYQEIWTHAIDRLFQEENIF